MGTETKEVVYKGKRYVKLTKTYSMSANSCNRGEDKLPKEIVFGGRLRDRHSSQTLKRIMRSIFIDRCFNSPWWSKEVAARIAKSLGIKGEEALPVAMVVFEAAKLAKPEKPKKGAAPEEAEGVAEKTDSEEDKDKDGNIMLRLSSEECDWLVKKGIEYFKLSDKEKKAFAKDKDIASEFLSVYNNNRKPEIAAFGRFLATSAKEMKDFSVDAAISASHAIGISEASPEPDDFTAVDDLGISSGAGHMNTELMSASTFIFEVSINMETLISNLGGNVALAIKTVEDIIRAFSYAVPSGKQHSMFSKPLPDFLMVEALDTEVSMADAFLAPVMGEDIATEGVRRLLATRERKYKAFDIDCPCEAMIFGVDPEKCGKTSTCSMNEACSKISTFLGA